MNFEIFSAEKTNNLEALMPGKAHPVRRTALALQPGESFIVLKKDWLWKTTTPRSITSSLSRNTPRHFACFTLPDKTGWLIKRLDGVDENNKNYYLSPFTKNKRNMSKTNEVIRKYKFSDAFLYQLIKRLLTAARRDFNELKTKGITAEFLNDLDKRNEDFLLLPDDVEKRGDKSVAVQSKDAIAARLADTTSDINNMAAIALKSGSAEYRSFGFEGINTETEDQRLKSYTRVARRCVTYKAKLEPKGLTDAFLELYVALVNDYKNALEAIEDETMIRDIATEDRVTKGNTNYDDAVIVSNTGKTYWDDKDEAKYNDYIIYNTPSGGDEPPPAS